MRTTGRSGDAALTAWATCQPDMSGMARSLNTMSNRSRTTWLSASVLFVTTTTSCPRDESRSASAPATSSSSSTTRHRSGRTPVSAGSGGAPAASEIGTLRKPQTDGRAPARLALDDDPSAMARDDPVRDRQPESRALGSFGREERVEQLLANFLGHPDPGVLDPRLHLRVARRGTEPQTTALRHRIHGVQDEIRHHLAQLDRVTTDRGKWGQRRLDGNDDAPAL